MEIKKVNEIRINGRAIKNCNGKKLNALIYNDIKYVLEDGYVTLTIFDIDGIRNFEEVRVPKGSDVSILGSYGSNSLTIKVDDEDFTTVNLNKPSAKMFMKVDTVRIENIQRDYIVNVKWGNVLGQLKLVNTGSLGLNNTKTVSFTVSIQSQYSTTENLNLDYFSLEPSISRSLSRSGNTWSGNISTSATLEVQLYYESGGDFYSIFIDTEPYTITEYAEKSITALNIGSTEYYLNIVDNSWE